MSYSVKPANIFGRIGQEAGRGLSEAIPKEVERLRLAQGLKNLGDQKNLDPWEQFTGLLSVPGVLDRPQIQQSAGEFLRQKSILNSINKNNEPPVVPPQKPIVEDTPSPKTATTTSSTKAKLEPYIPPSGAKQENMARKLMADEPLVYRDIDSARAAVAREIAANLQKSQAEIGKAELERDVQSGAEKKLIDQIDTYKAQIPGRSLAKLQQQAVKDIVEGKYSEDQAKDIYAKKADEQSRDWAKIHGWGGPDLITNKPKDLFNSIKSIKDKYPDRQDRRDIADEMVGTNGLSPQFAYAQMIPVNETPELNAALKALPDLSSKKLQLPGAAGILGLGLHKGRSPEDRTKNIVPTLLKAMGTTGSPLAVGYELDKKGYSSDVWKNYLTEHKGELTGDQYDELGLTQKGFSGWLNDWWFKSFTGIE